MTQLLEVGLAYKWVYFPIWLRGLLEAADSSSLVDDELTSARNTRIKRFKFSQSPGRTVRLFLGLRINVRWQLVYQHVVAIVLILVRLLLRNCLINRGINRNSTQIKDSNPEYARISQDWVSIPSCFKWNDHLLCHVSCETDNNRWDTRTWGFAYRVCEII